MTKFLKRAWAEIDVDALIHNFNIIKNTANSNVCAVVKANAYGHDVDIVAPILQDAGADCFAVSNIEEAIELRELGIVKPILILGYTPCEFASELQKHDISQCVYSLDYAKELSNEAAKQNLNIKVHLKLDTGMSRIGFDCRDDRLNGISDAIVAAKLDGFALEGVFTHFAFSDRNESQDDGFTAEQYNRFVNALAAIKNAGLNPAICHCSNSAAICLDSDKHLDMCRAGIILYGLTPSSELELEQRFIPVMDFKSVISQVKEIAIGDTVSYGRTFKADKNMTIATVSCGYADGYPRLLSNRGFVMINGKRANIVGRVCMDQFCVDVTDIKDVKRGDEVLLWGKDLAVETLADIIGTINYEMVCSVSSRVKRIKKEQ
ncbi:MAG: alanine racemase [Clostridia bacterium]|nr:alanine racemase [Clostridia bacterium]